MAGMLAAACSSGGSHGSPAHDGGAFATDVASPAQDAGSADATTDAFTGAIPVAFLRVAQFSADVPPSDFCVAAPSGSPFRGPLLGQLASAISPSGDAGAARASSLSFGQVSAYFTVRAEAFDLRFVAPGAAGCDVSVPSADSGPSLEIDALPSPAERTFFTLLVLAAPGSANAGGSFVEIADDGALASGGAAIRAVNAVAGAGSQDFGFGSFDGGWQALFTNVPFGAVSREAGPAEGTTDSNGYLAVAPFAGHTLSARPGAGATADADTAVGSNASLPLGGIASIFAIGAVGAAPDAAVAQLDADATEADASDAGASNATAPSGASLLLCIDNGAPVGPLADCAALH
jgi:hypothetical protein